MGRPLAAYLGAASRVGDLTPTLTRMTIAEAQEMLLGLMATDMLQLRSGVPRILRALALGSAGRGRRRLRYIRRDRNETWLNLRDIWAKGGGDCEDLAAGVAAEFNVFAGVPSRPVIVRVRPGLAHAVVEILDTGEIVDPSRIGGMGEGREVLRARRHV